MPGFRPLVGDEPKRLLEACQGPWAAQEEAFYALFIWTGLKPREALLMRFHDVYRRCKIVERIAAADEVYGDTYLLRILGDRSLVLNDEVHSALRKWVDVTIRMGRLRLDRPVFFHSGARDQALSLNFLWRQFRKTAARAGLDGRLSLHSLSKTFVVSYVQRTNFAYAKLRRVTGYDSPRNARRAYENACRLRRANFCAGEPYVRGREARVEPGAAEGQVLPRAKEHALEIGDTWGAKELENQEGELFVAFLARRKSVRVSAGFNPVGEAARASATALIPPELRAVLKGLPKVPASLTRMALLCREMQKLAGEGKPWFLACRKVEDELGLSHMQASRHLKALCALNIIRLVKGATWSRDAPNKGAQYRYLLTKEDRSSKAKAN